jgi:hypothetical protein
MKGRGHIHVKMNDMYGQEYVDHMRLNHLIDNLSNLVIIILYAMITIIILSYILSEDSKKDKNKKLK